MPGIDFGTDGWRAVVAGDFTFDTVRVVAQAISDYLNSERRENRVAVGFDARFQSDRFAQIVCEVLAGNRIHAILTDSPIPTPAVSLGIKRRHLNGGIIVTASHNPPQFNGIKFKTHFGSSADSPVTKRIEELCYKNKPERMDFAKARDRGLVKIEDFEQEYLNFLRSYVDLELLKKKKFRIVVDTMHGVGAGFFQKVLKGTGYRVDCIHEDRDPLFGGLPPEPIPKNLQDLSRLMKQGAYSVGLAVDGDADRIGAVRPDGEFVSSGQIISLLLLHFLEYRGWTGAVAKTISGTSMIDQISDEYKLKLYETPVGFKHIGTLMLEDEILIGGEESGGVGFKNYIPERDGILAGLLLLEMMAARRAGIIQIMKEAERRFGTYRYLREDLEYPDCLKKRLYPSLKKKPLKRLAGKRLIQVKSYDGMKFIAEDGSWLLFRLSGTEPILRIYAEAGTKKRVSQLMKLGKRVAFGV